MAGARDVEAADEKQARDKMPLQIVRYFHMSWFAVVIGCVEIKV